MRSCRETRAGNYRQVPEKPVTHTERRKKSFLICNLHLLGLQFIPQGSAAPTANTGAAQEPGRDTVTGGTHCTLQSARHRSHKQLLPWHSWISPSATAGGCSMGTAGPAPCPSPPLLLALPAQIPKVSHTRGSTHSNTPTAVGRTMISIYFVSYTSIF